MAENVFHLFVAKINPALPTFIFKELHLIFVIVIALKSYRSFDGFVAYKWFICM
jgi:hypothetical protein